MEKYNTNFPYVSDGRMVALEARMLKIEQHQAAIQDKLTTLAGMIDDNNPLTKERAKLKSEDDARVQRGELMKLKTQVGNMETWIKQKTGMDDGVTWVDKH